MPWKNMNQLKRDLATIGVEVVDRRGEALGGNPRNRNINNLTTFAVHWDGVARLGHVSGIQSHENYWRTVPRIMGDRGGYHGYLSRDAQGNVQFIINYDPETTSHGVGNQNGYTIHFCYSGSPKNPMLDLQRKALKIVHKWAREQIPNYKETLGHNEFPGHASNQCPGTNMHVLRNKLYNATIPTQKAVVTVKAGDTLWGIANAYDVTVDNLKAWNNLDSNLIHPGQKLKLKERETETVPVPTQPKFEQLVIDGSFGPATTRRLQQVLGTQVTGAIGGQQRTPITENIASVKFGSGGSMVVREMQRRLNLPSNQRGGLFGPLTLRALQRRMGTPVTGAISRTNSAVVKELQRRLNQNRF